MLRDTNRTTHGPVFELGLTQIGLQNLLIQRQFLLENPMAVVNHPPQSPFLCDRRK